VGFSPILGPILCDDGGRDIPRVVDSRTLARVFIKSSVHSESHSDSISGEKIKDRRKHIMGQQIQLSMLHKIATHSRDGIKFEYEIKHLIPMFLLFDGLRNNACTEWHDGEGLIAKVGTDDSDIHGISQFKHNVMKLEMGKATIPGGDNLACPASSL
jgi:hypothetical protein